MSTVASEIDLFEVIANYTGESGIPLTKGDVVKVIKKEIVWFTFEKDGKTGKAPKGKFRKCSQAGQAPIQNNSTFQPKMPLSSNSTSQPNTPLSSNNTSQPKIPVPSNSTFQPKTPISNSNSSQPNTPLSSTSTSQTKDLLSSNTTFQPKTPISSNTTFQPKTPISSNTTFQPKTPISCNSSFKPKFPIQSNSSQPNNENQASQPLAISNNPSFQPKVQTNNKFVPRGKVIKKSKSPPPNQESTVQQFNSSSEQTSNTQYQSPSQQATDAGYITMDKYFPEPHLYADKFGVGYCCVLKRKNELGPQFANRSEDIFLVDFDEQKNKNQQVMLYVESDGNNAEELISGIRTSNKIRVCVQLSQANGFFWFRFVGVIKNESDIQEYIKPKILEDQPWSYLIIGGDSQSNSSSQISICQQASYSEPIKPPFYMKYSLKAKIDQAGQNTLIVPPFSLISNQISNLQLQQPNNLQLQQPNNLQLQQPNNIQFQDSTNIQFQQQIGPQFQQPSNFQYYQQFAPYQQFETQQQFGLQQQFGSQQQFDSQQQYDIQQQQMPQNLPILQNQYQPNTPALSQSQNILDIKTQNQTKSNPFAKKQNANSAVQHDRTVYQPQYPNQFQGQPYPPPSMYPYQNFQGRDIQTAQPVMRSGSGNQIDQGMLSSQDMAPNQQFPQNQQMMQPTFQPMQTYYPSNQSNFEGQLQDFPADQTNY